MQWLLYPATEGDGRAEELRLVCKLFLQEGEEEVRGEGAEGGMAGRRGED